MEQKKESRERAAAGTSNVFSLAVAVGLITFFIAGEWTGGLTGIQGFFVGSSIIVFLFIIAVTFSNFKSRSSEQNINLLSRSESSPVSRSDSEGRIIIINVYVDKNLVGSHEVDNV
jgi:cation transport ATPase